MSTQSSRFVGMIIVLLSHIGVAVAEDLPGFAPGVFEYPDAQYAAVNTQDQPRSSSPLKRWSNSDILRIKWGVGHVRLKNPGGFDIASEAYGDADEYEPNPIPLLGLSLERRIARDGQLKRVLGAQLDWQDYEGLELTNLMFDYGFLLSPPSHRHNGFRIGAGIGAGVTRSKTFFDRAWHSSVEASANAGIQLKRFVLELTHVERKTIERTLDERSAGPRTRVTMLTVGLLF